MSNTTRTPKKYTLWNVEMRTFSVERYLKTKSFYVTIRDVVTKFNPHNHPTNHSLSNGWQSLGNKGQLGTLTQKSLAEIVTQDERGSGMRCLSSACGNQSKTRRRCQELASRIEVRHAELYYAPRKSIKYERETRGTSTLKD